MTPTTAYLTRGLYNGQTCPGHDGPTNQYIPIKLRPQLTALLLDIRANQSRALPDLQKLLNRCYAVALYDGPHALHDWRQCRELAAQAVILQAAEKGFTYNPRSRQFRDV